MIAAPAPKWIDTSLIFLLEINWGGYTYRFSTKPIIITDGSSSYQFMGGLEDPEIKLQLTRGFNIEGDSIPFRLIFPVDVAKQQAKGNYLDGATGELFYVFEKSGNPIQSYEDRYIIFKGIVSQPVYGFPEQPTGYVEFSLEERVFVEELDLRTAIVGTAGRLDQTDISNPDKSASSPLTAISTGSLVDVATVHEGKPFPVIIGKTGHAYSLSTMALRDIASTPAYLIGIGAVAPLPGYFLIAGHLVEATSVKIYDSQGHSDTAAVDNWVNDNGDIFSFASVNFSTTTLANAKVNEEIEYWVTWDLAGGYPSPYNAGALEGGADVLLWALDLVTKDIDYDSFCAAMPLLNKYKFAGYINEGVSPINFIESNIIPYLPVEIGIGPKGIRPIVNLALSGEHITPIEIITADSSFYRAGPIKTDTDYSNIINQINIRYAKSGIKDKYQGTIRVVPTKTGAAWFEFTNDYAYSSYQQFGLRSTDLVFDYVYDYKTAVQIAEDYIKLRSLPKRTIMYSASPKWGFLWIGDIVEITDNDINLSSAKAQLIGKQWTGSNWELTFELEINPLIGGA